MQNVDTTRQEPPKFAGEYLIVIICGLATSALSLMGMYWFDTSQNENIMGWYADYIIPAGALIVGFAASSGYGVASWLRGIKITSKLLACIVVLQIVVYFAAKYIEFANLHLVYSQTNEPVSFWTYFDQTTRTFAWREEGTGKLGSPLGVWGYGLRVLEIIGFVLGSLAGPAMLRGKPYCSDCAIYMKSLVKTTIPASVPARKVKKKDIQGQQAYASENQVAYESGRQSLISIFKNVETGDSHSCKAKLTSVAAEKKLANKLTTKIVATFSECPYCRKGEVRAKQVSGQGKKIQIKEIFRKPLRENFASELK